jgi:hypothetical protein
MRPYAQVPGILRISHRDHSSKDELLLEGATGTSTQQPGQPKTEQAAPVTQGPKLRFVQADIRAKMNERVNVKSSFLSKFTNSDLQSAQAYPLHRQCTMEMT